MKETAPAIGRQEQKEGISNAKRIQSWMTASALTTFLAIAASVEAPSAHAGVDTKEAQVAGQMAPDADWQTLSTYEKLIGSSNLSSEERGKISKFEKRLNAYYNVMPRSDASHLLTQTYDFPLSRAEWEEYQELWERRNPGLPDVQTTYQPDIDEKVLQYDLEDLQSLDELRNKILADYAAGKTYLRPEQVPIIKSTIGTKELLVLDAMGSGMSRVTLSIKEYESIARKRLEEIRKYTGH